MNKRIILFSLLLISLHTTGWSQLYRKTDNGVKTRIQSIDVEVQFFSPQIVRIIKLPAGAAVKNKSLAVIALPQKLPLAITAQKNELKVNSGSLQVTIDQQTGAIRFYTAQGNLLLQEKENGAHFSPSKDSGSYE